MSFKINKCNRNYRRVLIPGIMIGILMVASIGLAGQSGNATGVIRNITPMTELGSHRGHVNAADFFDIVGILNSVEGNLVTIGDRKLSLAPGVGTYGMRQYNTVGANLNRAGEVVALELVSNEPN